jgi:hypothetical protein
MNMTYLLSNHYQYRLIYVNDFYIGKLLVSLPQVKHFALLIAGNRLNAIFYGICHINL